MAKKQIIPRLKIWLLEGKPITQKEAIIMWNAYRLSHSIFILRTKYGMNIETEMCSTSNSVYAKYFIPKPIKLCNLLTSTTKIDHTEKATSSLR